jgi:hypothetical protein
MKAIAAGGECVPVMKRLPRSVPLRGWRQEERRQPVSPPNQPAAMGMDSHGDEGMECVASGRAQAWAGLDRLPVGAPITRAMQTRSIRRRTVTPR